MEYLKVERRKDVYFNDFHNDNNHNYNACGYNKFIKKKKLGIFLILESGISFTNKEGK